MTRMIERWFPCRDVGRVSHKGWGTGNSEKALFTWFATRPLAQAKAAVITSLLPWPDDPDEQQRLQSLVREALQGRDAAQSKIRREIERTHPDGASMVDPFAGRAVIPLEAARLGVGALGIDYAPVATLAGQLLADYPLRDWSSEPPLPFATGNDLLHEERLVADVERVVDEIDRRWDAAMADYYPTVNGRQPWGYLWAATLPCQECSRRFPLVGSLALRPPQPKKSDPGQSYRIDADPSTSRFRAVVHEGPPAGEPTMITVKGARGKSAVCPFCQHVHPIKVHSRLADEGLLADALLVVADPDEEVGKLFREPEPQELEAVEAAEQALKREPDFGLCIPAFPSERIPEGNRHTVRASKYGARTYGDLCNSRQTLGLIRLCRIIAELGEQLPAKGISQDYTAALCGYAASVMVRKLRRSTRGARLQVYADGRPTGVHDVFNSESAIAFSHDYFEVGISDAAGSWQSVASRTLSALRDQLSRAPGRPATVHTGSALSLPLTSGSQDAVITDPPYDNMIDYSDASDLFYTWIKRALSTTHPELAITSHPSGVQPKDEEIIVKNSAGTTGDHRTRAFYDEMISKAFGEAKRVVRDNGVVTIVFGHGDIDVWERLLAAVTDAGLVLTGSWPAQTEAGGQGGSANIVTTLTMACRPAPADRPDGRVNDVDAEVRREIASRLPLWEDADLATHDQLMAAVGPALEAVGRYERVLDKRGQPVPLRRYLVLARQAVREAQNVKIDDLPLDTFDALTRFALDWVRLYGKDTAPASEARWQALAIGLDLDDVVGDVLEKFKSNNAEGVRLTGATTVSTQIDVTTPTIIVAFAVAAAWREGLEEAAEVLASAGREDDAHLWAAIGFLADKLPESDPDGQAWTRMVRARSSVTSTAQAATAGRRRAAEEAEAAARQGSLLDE